MEPSTRRLASVHTRPRLPRTACPRAWGGGDSRPGAGEARPPPPAPQRDLWLQREVRTAVQCSLA